MPGETVKCEDCFLGRVCCKECGGKKGFSDGRHDYDCEYCSGEGSLECEVCGGIGSYEVV